MAGEKQVALSVNRVACGVLTMADSLRLFCLHCGACNGVPTFCCLQVLLSNRRGASGGPVVSKRGEVGAFSPNCIRT